jgi:hypothetical protein
MWCRTCDKYYPVKQVSPLDEQALIDREKIRAGAARFIKHLFGGES